MVNKILAPDERGLAEERNTQPDIHHLATGFIILGIKPYFGRVFRIRGRKFSIDIIAAEL